MRESTTTQKKAEDMMNKFLQITSSVGTQIQGMNSSIVKMKEEGDDRYKQFNERITNIEKILDMMKKRISKWRNQRRTCRSESRHSSDNRIPQWNVRVWSYTTLERIDKWSRNGHWKCKNRVSRETDHTRVYPRQEWRRNKFIRSANMLKKELRGRKIKITRSMNAEERFHNKRIWYVKYCINMKHNVPLESISTNWTMKCVSNKGQIVVKTVQSGNLKFFKYQDVEAEVEDRMQKWQSKNSSQTTVSSREKGMRRREEWWTMSSQKTITSQRNHSNERCTSEGGGRDKLKKVDGDFPSRMRKIETIMEMKQERRKTWREKEEDNSSITPSMEKYRAVSEENSEGKQRWQQQQRKEARGKWWAKRSTETWTKWRVEAKIC